MLLDFLFQNLDLTKHRFVHDGPLVMRVSKAKGAKSDQHDVHAVLLQDMIVLLFRQDERFVLKIITVNNPSRMMTYPIIKLNNLILREVARGECK